VDRQTDRHTNMLITILCTHTGDEVTTGPVLPFFQWSTMCFVALLLCLFSVWIVSAPTQTAVYPV